MKHTVHIYIYVHEMTYMEYIQYRIYRIYRINEMEMFINVQYMELHNIIIPQDIPHCQ